MAIIKGFNALSSNTWLVLTMGAICYLIGIKVGSIFLKNRGKSFLKLLSCIVFMASYVLIAYYLFSNSSYLALLISLPTIYMAYIFKPNKFGLKTNTSPNKRPLKLLGVIALSLSLALYVSLLYTVGLFKSKFEYHASPLRDLSLSIYLIGSLMLLESSTSRRTFWIKLLFLSLAAAMLAFLVSSRIYLMATALLFAIYIVLKNKISAKKLLPALTLTIIILYALAGELLFNYALQGLHYLDLVVNRTPPVGKMFGTCTFNVVDSGVIIHQYVLDSYPEIFGSEAKAGNIALASTWLGSSYLDFGYIGIIFASMLLGISISSNHRSLINLGNEQSLKRSLLTIQYSANLTYTLSLIHITLNLPIIIATLLSLHLTLMIKRI